MGRRRANGSGDKIQKKKKKKNPRRSLRLKKNQSIINQSSHYYFVIHDCMAPKQRLGAIKTPWGLGYLITNVAERLGAERPSATRQSFYPSPKDFLCLAGGSCMEFSFLMLLITSDKYDPLVTVYAETFPIIHMICCKADLILLLCKFLYLYTILYIGTCTKPVDPSTGQVYPC